MPVPFLQIKKISRWEEGSAVLQDISFTREKFQRLAITGESGAGKTTLMKIIAGLIQPDSGQVLLNNRRVEGPLEKLIAGHRQIAYLSQHYELLHRYRVEEVLDMSVNLSGEEAHQLYSVCRIDHLLKRLTSQLSGGERQRVALAKLLGQTPELLLLDEPYAHLDRMHKEILQAVLHELTSTQRVTCIVTSHDPEDTLPWADEIIVLKNGKVVQSDTPHAIYHRPANEYVAGLFGQYLVVDDALKKMFPSLLLEDSVRFLRAEDLRIAENGETGLPATVHQVLYLGSHYNLELNLGYRNFTIASAADHFVVGQPLQIVLKR